LEQLVERPVWVVPWKDDLGLDDEDGLAIEARLAAPRAVDPARRQVVVVCAPYLAMATDVAALERDPELQVHCRDAPPDAEARVDVVLLPGSRLVCADLTWLRSRGFDRWIEVAAARGAAIVGVCGGYQMLGAQIADPLGVEGPPGVARGLGLLPV